MLRRPEEFELFKNIDRLILAGSIPDKGLTMVLTAAAPLDPEKVRQAFVLGPSQNIQGKDVYKSPPGGQAKVLVTQANDKTLLVTNYLNLASQMPEGEFLKLTEAKGKLSPLMQKQADALGQKTLWAIINLQAGPKEKPALPQLGPEPVPAEVLTALLNAKIASFSVGAANGLDLRLEITCANEKDAGQLESFTKNLWEKEGKPKLLTLPEMPDSAELGPLVGEISQNFKIGSQGPVVAASLVISEAARKTLETLANSGSNPPPKQKAVKKK